MQINRVCVLGGTGFVGRHLCDALAARGYEIVAPTRRWQRARDLTLLPTVEALEANVHDTAELERVLRGADACINLIGVLHDERGGASFAQAHVALPEKVVNACRHCGVKRLLHMSAVNASPQAPSAYLRSKGEGERAVRESNLAFTVFRPSVIFGREDRFLNLFARLQRVLPVVFLGSPGARFQPVYAGDVAAAFVAAVEEPAAIGASYDLCGPRTYALRDLVKYAGETSGHPRPIVGLGPRLSWLQAALMEFAPGKLLTRDNYRSMKLDSVCGCQLPFGLRATPLEAVAPAWLKPGTRRSFSVSVR